jgi:hypothetical protein
LCDASNALLEEEGGKGDEAGWVWIESREATTRARPSRIKDNKRQRLSFIRAILVSQPRSRQLLHSRRPLPPSDDARVSRHPHSLRHLVSTYIAIHLVPFNFNSSFSIQSRFSHTSSHPLSLLPYPSPPPTQLYQLALTMSGKGGKAQSGEGAASKSTSRSSKAGLQFPVGRIHRLLRKGNYAREHQSLSSRIYFLDSPLSPSFVRPPRANRSWCPRLPRRRPRVPLCRDPRVGW